jgi:hypothetical protein
MGRTEKEVREAFEALTGLNDDGIKAFEDKVNETIQSCLTNIRENKDADTVEVYEFVRDNYKGAELILFASQMLSELLQFILTEENSGPTNMGEVLAMMLQDKLESDLASNHVAVKGDA